MIWNIIEKIEEKDK